MTTQQEALLFVAAISCAFSLGMKLQEWMRRRDLERYTRSLHYEPGITDEDRELAESAGYKYVELPTLAGARLIAQTPCPHCGSTCRAAGDEHPERPPAP